MGNGIMTKCCQNCTKDKKGADISIDELSQLNNNLDKNSLKPLEIKNNHEETKNNEILNLKSTPIETNIIINSNFNQNENEMKKNNLKEVKNNNENDKIENEKIIGEKKESILEKETEEKNIEKEMKENKEKEIKEIKENEEKEIKENEEKEIKENEEKNIENKITEYKNIIKEKEIERKMKQKDSQTSTDIDLRENVVKEKNKEINKKKKIKQKFEKTILIYGAQESGKTSFIIRYIENKFDSCYIPSFQDEITKKNCYLNYGKKFDLEFIVSNNTNTIQEADCYFIFYDLSSNNSFQQAKKLIRQIVKLNQTVFLIGNKKDLKNVVKENNINDLCKKYKVESFLISVKDNIGISFMMQRFGQIFDYEN